MSKSKRIRRSSPTNQQGTRRNLFGQSQKVIIGTVSIVLIGVLVWLPKENQAGFPEVTVYKSPTCGCCGKWIDHMKEKGFKVITHNRQDMNQIKQEYGVDYKLRSCHTAVVEDYVLEGHIPAEDIRRLLKERPAVDGLAVPGMPAGSPGMESKNEDLYEVIAFAKGKKNAIYERH
ncbi:DUF411 domain-containing protein [Sedimenticola selenatireducens]|uniref:DUF411 domain-containing protein n=1 Tax=Sedimenticola selenatireducens TaxID=191960 RepID=UPI0004BC11B9|nr:DUF411 domain-containing protein [Sedimenticola selenatireducens]